MDYPRFKQFTKKNPSNLRNFKEIEDRCEEWFRERKGIDTKDTWRKDLVEYTSLPKFVPPKIKSKCRICKECPEKTRVLECKHEHCEKCTVFYEELENRCPTCRKPIHSYLYDLYDGCEVLKIPSYDNFLYSEF